MPPLPLEKAQAQLLELATPVPLEQCPPAQALGRYLAAPLLARRTQPARDLSAMDGYAVRIDDLAGPWRVIGESAAGHPFTRAPAPGEAVRIATGAALPDGAGAVILQEDIARDGDTIRLTGTLPAPPHRHIRPTGMDFRAGDTVLPAGTRIGPAQLALALAAGAKELPVCRPLHLAVIDSGDELAEDADSCLPHQIPASNGAMLAALAAPLVGSVQRIGPVPDRLDAVLQAFEQAVDADVIVTSGGASVGDHDLIRPALESWGASLDFWRVAIKPGKPLLVAHRGAQIILGLPGNPVSSHVTAYLFLLPLLRAMQGAASPLPRRIATTLARPLKPGGGRREFLRALWDGETVTALALQDSGALSSLALANALIDRPANAPAAAAGEQVRAYLLENGGIA